MRILQYPRGLAEALAEPEISRTLAAETTSSTDTWTYYQDRTDADTAVEIERETGYDASGNLVRQELFQVVNAPEITTVVSDQPVTSEINADGTTEITITGANFGADVTHLHVLLRCIPRKTLNIPRPTRDSRVEIAMEITSLTGGNQIVAQVSLPTYSPGYNEIVAGECEIEVTHNKRLLASDRFVMTLA